jgi:hypothetical protein
MVAYAALLIWPFVTLAIFASMRPERAVIWSLLSGYLLLPVKTSFDFPGVPALDKTSIANLSAFVVAMFYTGGRSIRLPREWWLVALMLTYLISPMLTVFSNGDPLIFGGLILPGLKPYDAFSAAAYKAIDLIPFVLGYNLFRTPAAQNEVLRSLVVAVLAYSVLMLIEIRLSPQLHTWIYGFFPHSFEQQVRGDGFRPVVFLGHGLVVAILVAMAIAAAGYLSRRQTSLFSIPSRFWLVYLVVILVLCKSLGALIISLSAVIINALSNTRTKRVIFMFTALLVLSYPALRGADLIPVQMIADQVAQYNEERGESFQTRIDNERLLLARASQRPWFGWGGYGRNRVFDEGTGKDLSITDGTWIIIVGTNGWVGYFAAFGILCLPILLMGRSSHSVSLARDGIALVLAVNLLDLVPNSSLSPITWLLAGAVVPIAIKRVNSPANSLIIAASPQSLGRV